MKAFTKMNKDELLTLKKSLEQRYQEFKALDLKLDMSRGKPCGEQLDLSMSILDMKECTIDNIECRNYGGLEGLPSIRRLFAQLLEVDENEVLQIKQDGDENKAEELELILGEYGQKHISVQLSKYYLIEHGETIIENKAITLLSKCFTC